ncbi:MAG: serine hydrolase [Fidelibacterota bacterium]|nr:MAG: serine hydrolase [Candidatus Neomarinimicrobiota bacterium]
MYTKKNTYAHLLVFCWVLLFTALSLTTCTRPDLPAELVGKAKEIESLFDNCYDPSLPGGFAVAVIKDGQVVFKDAYGFANNEHEVPFTTHTVSDLASVAKQFTGLAVAMLIQEGKLSPDDDIRRYLPEIPDFGDPITVRHLLYHTSGIRDWVGLVKISGRYMEDVITDDFLMRLVLNQRELNFRPGERIRYSNTGYFLLATIVSRVAEQPFSEWMRHNVFLPLNMSNTQIGYDHRTIIPHRASSYGKDSKGDLRNNTSNLEAYGSSSLFSTLDDMVRWVVNYETRSIGGHDAWDMMLQKGALNSGEAIDYGFGISIHNNGSVLSFGHGGSWGGYLSQVTYYPELRLGYVLMTNRDPSGVYVDDELVRLFLPDTSGAVTEEPAGTPQRMRVAVDARLLDEYAGSYEFFDKVVVIQAGGDHLLVHLPWEAVEFYAESDNKFFRQDFDAQFEFFRNDEGHVDRLVYHFRGSPNPPFRRLDEDVSGQSEVAEVLGEYESPELRTRYKVMIKDKRLILWHLQNEEIGLLRLDRDHYLGNKWWCEEIEILRDEDDKVTGFTLTADGGNIQNLLFVKQ